MNKTNATRTLKASLLLSTLALSACATLNLNIYPKGQDNFQIVATSAEESEAINGAVDRAQEVCNNQHKKLMIIKQDVVYSGVNKHAKLGMDIAHNMAFLSNSSVSTPGSYTVTKDDDYKVTLDFKCSSSKH